jgi:hypothetical protein
VSSSCVATWRCGVNGFRAWTDAKPPPGFVLCPCGWAGLKHYAGREFVAYYRADPKAYARRVRALEREWTVTLDGMRDIGRLY